MTDELDISKRPGGEDGLSLFDKKILSLASQGLSPEEIAAQSGGTPARVGQRIREILKTRDWLSIMEKKQLLLGDFYELRDYMLFMMDKDKNPDQQYDFKGNAFIPPSDPRWSGNMLSLLTQLRKMLEDDQKSVQANMGMIRDTQAKLMVSAIGVAFEAVLKELHELYPQIDPEVVYTIMERALPRAFETVEARVMQ